MSTSSKPKSRAPAHQNRTAFRHNKGSKLTKKIAETAHTGGLCHRCSEKVEWRIKYRKYKPLSSPRKCNRCGNRAIKSAYRTICPACAGHGPGRICQGCGASVAVNGAVVTPAERNHADNVAIEVVKNMSERQRRVVQRRVDRGEDVSDVVRDVAGGLLDSDDEGDASGADDTDEDAGDGVGDGTDDGAGDGADDGAGEGEADTEAGQSVAQDGTGPRKEQGNPS